MVPLFFKKTIQMMKNIFPNDIYFQSSNPSKRDVLTMHIYLQLWNFITFGFKLNFNYVIITSTIT